MNHEHLRNLRPTCRNTKQQHNPILYTMVRKQDQRTRRSNQRSTKKDPCIKNRPRKITRTMRIYFFVFILMISACAKSNDKLVLIETMDQNKKVSKFTCTITHFFPCGATLENCDNDHIYACVARDKYTEIRNEE